MMVIWVLETTLKKPLRNIGIENFTKEILYVFDNEFQMNEKEQELVTEEFCDSQDTYNICPGGKGGFGYINGHEKAKEWKIKAGKIGGKIGIETFWNSEKNRNIVSKRQSLFFKKMHENDKNLRYIFLGKSHSEETKKKMSESSKGMGTCINNSQYGTMWITNGSENKKIKNLDSMPEGWYKGRKL